MTRHLLTIAAAAAASLAFAGTASADTLVTSAPGATNLAQGGGYMAWAAPAGGGRFRLVLRAPDGTVTTPSIQDFARAPDPAIGSDRFAAAGRRLVVLFSREDASGDADIHALDVRAGTEEPVAGLSTAAYDETAPAMASGRITFVRSGGRRNGVFLKPGERVRRIASTVASETATNGSRVAFSTRSGITIRRLSGEGRDLRIRTSNPTSINLTRYQAAWLSGGRALRTDRFAGSGGPFTLRVRAADREVAAGTVSLAVGASLLRVLLLDAEGVKAPSPPLFSRFG